MPFEKIWSGCTVNFLPSPDVKNSATVPLEEVFSNNAATFVSPVETCSFLLGEVVPMPTPVLLIVTLSVPPVLNVWVSAVKPI